MRNTMSCEQGSTDKQCRLMLFCNVCCLAKNLAALSCTNCPTLSILPESNWGKYYLNTKPVLHTDYTLFYVPFQSLFSSIFQPEEH